MQAQLDPVRKRIKPRVVLNFVTGFDLLRETSHVLTLQAGVNNVLDRFFLYNFRSVFSGTHLGRPRELFVRLVVNWQKGK